ncbi:unnamed protein product [Haemonchus placei]|uniref:Uncharacterized protein n=1 Tax=Haemonchus placei TaxID=6290 RepID=A0A0N4WYC5_HAEPC|nr:unnamed protein product [Haemonchus placei]
MFGHYIPPELSDLVQASVFVPLVGPNGRLNGRNSPYTFPMAHLPVTHISTSRVSFFFDPSIFFLFRRR